MRGDLQIQFLQTPQTDHRRSKSASDSSAAASRNHRKITRKRLNPVIKSVSEEDSAISKEISDDNCSVINISSPPEIMQKSLDPMFKAVSEDDFALSEFSKDISEVSDDNPFIASPQNFLAPVNDTPPSEASPISDLTSPSSCITSGKSPVINASDTTYEHPKLDSFKEIESAEVEMVIKHLKEARTHILKSNVVGPSKKLLDALITVIFEEFYGGLYHEEKNWLDKLISTKANLVFMSLMLGIFIFSLSNSRAEEFGTRLKPT